jgi:two-component system cell cycle response regulator
VKVLIAEDDRVSRRLLEVTLDKWGYELIVCKDGLAAWESLQKPDAPRLAILDWMMPGKDGVRLCREIRARSGHPYVYVILLTSRNSRDDMIMGLDAGADDYLSKPFDQRELELRLRTGRRILDLQSELISAREALRIQATHDSLTGIWNRSAILETLENELSRAQRQGLSLAAIITDLDHFKKINDTYGHTVGDAVLREAARRMRAAMRPYDGLGRYGGEEFLIVAPGCDTGNGLLVAERLRLAITNEPILTPEVDLSISASFGLAALSGSHSIDTDNLISAADEALYRAKSAGRNRIEAATLLEIAGRSNGTPDVRRVC